MVKDLINHDCERYYIYTNLIHSDLKKAMFLINLFVISIDNSTIRYQNREHYDSHKPRTLVCVRIYKLYEVH